MHATASSPSHSPPPARMLFQRTTALIGTEGMRSVAAARGIVLGLGGVGSWCAESLVRTGVRELTLVDPDRICATNVNRQLPATCATLGRGKADALRDRLQEVNPHARIVAVARAYDRDSAEDFAFDEYDFVVDAIDSLSAKALLLSNASRTRATVYTSLGAAAKLDPTAVRVTDFWEVRGCPLGAMLRKCMRRWKLPLAKPVIAVYSEETMAGHAAEGSAGVPEAEDPGWRSPKAVVHGSVAHVTGIFGLTLAGLVIRGLVRGGCPTDSGSTECPT